jgi:uncharacterized protein (TIGR03546 family)
VRRIRAASGGIWMLSFFVAPLRRAVQSLLAGDSPNELAAGFTLGMVIGLLPKGNLIALSLCVLLFSLRVNKSLALVAAVLFSCLGGVVDPLAHKVGLIVLSADQLEVSYAALWSIPIGPWIGFNNTVVTGSLLVGLYVAYPVFWAVQTAAVRFGGHRRPGSRRDDRSARRAGGAS